MAKKSCTTFLVHKDGVLEIKDFTARTFADALKRDLPKGWEKKPQKLAKAVMRSPDLLTIIIGIMNSFSEYLWRERGKVEDAIAKRTGEVEASCSKDKAFDATLLRDDKELKGLYKTLAFYDERLWALEERTPHVWLAKLQKTEFPAIVEGVQQFLAEPVNDAWCAYSPALDCAEGQAVETTRRLSADMLEALQLKFCLAEGASLPLAVATDLSAEDANKVAQKLKLEMHFVADKPTAAPAQKKKASLAKKPVAKKSTTKPVAKKAKPAAKAVKPVAKRAKPAARKAKTVAKRTKPAAKRPVAKKTAPAKRKPASRK